MRSHPFRSVAVTAPGGRGDLPAISLPNGEARGIVIDNPSGSWLSVFPLHDFVPPYTLQWSRDFPYGIANATVRYVAGPASQPSSIEGEPITVWLDSEPVGSSNGIATPGRAFRPLSTTTIDDLQTLTWNGLQTNLIAVNAGRRARIYSFRISHAAEAPPASLFDLSFRWVLQPNPFPVGGQAYAFGEVNASRGHYDEIDFTTNPRDVPLDFAVAISLISRWADITTWEYSYHLRYSLV